MFRLTKRWTSWIWEVPGGWGCKTENDFKIFKAVYVKTTPVTIKFPFLTVCKSTECNTSLLKHDSTLGY